MRQISNLSSHRRSIANQAIFYIPSTDISTNSDSSVELDSRFLEIVLFC